MAPERGKGKAARRIPRRYRPKPSSPALVPRSAGHPAIPARGSAAAAQHRLHADLPDLDPTTTLVISRWDYLGSGYSPGAALLAGHVWQRRELERQFAAEGGC